MSDYEKGYLQGKIDVLLDIIKNNTNIKLSLNIKYLPIDFETESDNNENLID